MDATVYAEIEAGFLNRRWGVRISPGPFDLSVFTARFWCNWAFIWANSIRIHDIDGVFEVGFRDDVVAIEDARGQPSPQGHRGFLPDAFLIHVPGERSAQVVKRPVGLQDLDALLDLRADLNGRNVAGEAGLVAGG